MSEGNKPVRRATGLVVQEVEGELLVYDLERHRAHRLNGAAAVVFRKCDGKSSVAEIAGALRREVTAGADEVWVQLALDRLHRAHLLDAPSAASGPSLSRRVLTRRMATWGSVGALLPVVSSIVAPTPVQAAATCVTDCTGQPFGTPCSSTAPTNCFCTCDGSGVCVGGC